MSAFRWTRMSAVMVVGLSIGLGVGWMVWGRAPDYPVRVAEILRTNCQPFLDDLTLVTDGLVEVNGQGMLDFADKTTGLMVTLAASGDKRRSCTVSDTLKPVDLQVWADVYERMQIAWVPLLAVSNGEPPLVIDLSTEGVGAPHMMMRPRGIEGQYLSFIKFNHDPRTEIEVGYATFNSPVGQEETL